MLQKLQHYTALFTVFICLLLSSPVNAQRHTPVTWHFRTEPTTGQQTTLVATAVLAPGWHIYSQFMEEGGPLPTQFTFDKSGEYSLIGKPEEKSDSFKFYDSIFMIDIIWLSKVAVFSQKIKLYTPYTNIKGKVRFMACTRDMCLPPDEQDFSIEVKPIKKP